MKYGVRGYFNAARDFKKSTSVAAICSNASSDLRSPRLALIVYLGFRLRALYALEAGTAARERVFRRHVKLIRRRVPPVLVSILLLAELGLGQAYGLPFSVRRPESALSAQGMALLKAAAADKHGMVMIRRLIGGTVVNAGKIQFAGDDTDRRELARWFAAIEEIHSAGLTRNINGQGEIFELTDAGYKIVDAK